MEEEREKRTAENFKTGRCRIVTWMPLVNIIYTRAHTQTHTYTHIWYIYIPILTAFYFHISVVYILYRDGGFFEPLENLQHSCSLKASFPVIFSGNIAWRFRFTHGEFAPCRKTTLDCCRHTNTHTHTHWHTHINIYVGIYII